MFTFWAGVCSVHVLNDRPTGTRVSGHSVIRRVIVFLYAHISSSLGLVHPFGTVHDCFFTFACRIAQKPNSPARLHCIGPLWPTMFEFLFVGSPLLVFTINVTAFDIIFYFLKNKKMLLVVDSPWPDSLFWSCSSVFSAFFSAGKFNRIQEINIFRPHV